MAKLNAALFLVMKKEIEMKIIPSNGNHIPLRHDARPKSFVCIINNLMSFQCTNTLTNFKALSSVITILST